MEVESGTQAVETVESGASEPLSDGKFSMREAFEAAERQLASTAEPVAQQAEPAKDPEPTEPEVPTEEVAPAAEPEAPAADDDIEPPTGWKPEEKEIFKLLPPEVRETISRREKERDAYLQKRTKDIASIEREYQTLDRVLEPYRQAYKLAGATDEQAITQALELATQISRNPTQAIQWIAQTHGVQLPQTQAQTDELDIPADPALQRLTAELNAIKQAMAGITQTHQGAQMAQVAQSVESFKAATGQDGQPLHPHYEAVRPRMAELAQRGVSSDLETLYRMAVAENPALMAEETKRASALAALKRLQAQRATAEKAQRVAAGGGIRSKPSAGPVQDRVTNIREAYDQAWAKVHGN